jgi:hypothetical protein
MSKAVSLKSKEMAARKGCCSICHKEEILSYTLKNKEHIKFCSYCYGEIPEHIPLLQDSLYVEGIIKKHELYNM